MRSPLDILSHVCGNQKQVFQAKKWYFMNHNQAVFVPQPNQSVSTALSENYDEKCIHRNIKLQHMEIWTYPWLAYIYIGNLFWQLGCNCRAKNCGLDVR